MDATPPPALSLWRWKRRALLRSLSATAGCYISGVGVSIALSFDGETALAPVLAGFCFGIGTWLSRWQQQEARVFLGTLPWPSHTLERSDACAHIALSLVLFPLWLLSPRLLAAPALLANLLAAQLWGVSIGLLLSGGRYSIARALAAMALGVAGPLLAGVWLAGFAAAALFLVFRKKGPVETAVRDLEQAREIAQTRTDGSAGLSSVRLPLPWRALGLVPAAFLGNFYQYVSLFMLLFFAGMTFRSPCATFLMLWGVICAVNVSSLLSAPLFGVSGEFLFTRPVSRKRARAGAFCAGAGLALIIPACGWISAVRAGDGRFKREIERAVPYPHRVQDWKALEILRGQGLQGPPEPAFQADPAGFGRTPTETLVRAYRRSVRDLWGLVAGEALLCFFLFARRAAWDLGRRKNGAWSVFVLLVFAAVLGPFFASTLKVSFPMRSFLPPVWLVWLLVPLAAAWQWRRLDRTDVV